jgi:hypothetical protein
VDRYYKETMEASPGYSESQAWATAWSRYCKYKDPGSDHCKKDTGDYFPGKRKSAATIPSEERGGKPGYDDDFKAGFTAGEAAYKADDNADGALAKKKYKRVSKKHGQWWVEGFIAAVDWARGADRTKNVQIAKKLGLKLRVASEDIDLLAKVARLIEERPEFRDKLLPLCDKTAKMFPADTANKLDRLTRDWDRHGWWNENSNGMIYSWSGGGTSPSTEKKVVMLPREDQVAVLVDGRPWGDRVYPDAESAVEAVEDNLIRTAGKPPTEEDLLWARYASGGLSEE